MDSSGSQVRTPIALWPHEHLPASPVEGILTRLRYISTMLREARDIEKAAHFTEADRRMLAHDARNVAVSLETLIFWLEHRE